MAQRLRGEASGSGVTERMATDEWRLGKPGRSPASVVEIEEELIKNFGVPRNLGRIDESVR